MKAHIWYGTLFGNWGHVGGDVPRTDQPTETLYTSLWPATSVKPFNPIGKTIPTTGVLSTFEIDKMAEATEFRSQTGGPPSRFHRTGDEDLDSIASDNYRQSLVPVPKYPDKTVNIPLNKDEQKIVQVNQDQLHKGVNTGEITYCGADITGSGCLNCISGNQFLLKGTRYEIKNLPKTTLPQDYAQALEKRIQEVNTISQKTQMEDSKVEEATITPKKTA